jgi:DNA-binding transcriptional ArsR family regulator
MALGRAGPHVARPEGGEEQLAVALTTLGNPVRLGLMHRLVAPKVLHEIEVRADDAGAPLSRQAVRAHLEQLLAAGLVVARPSSRDGRSPVEYVVNHQVIYALSEDVRALARLRPAVEPDNATVRAEAPARPLGTGRSLVVVHGLDVGASFALAPPTSDAPGQWTLGRRRGIAVSLDFDPYVSAEHALVVRGAGGGLALQDLPVSRNGTRLNFVAIPKGASAPLRHGDLVGVGQTLLLYRDA